MKLKLISALSATHSATHLGILSTAAEPALRVMRFVRSARCVRALRCRLDIIDKVPTS